MTERNVLPSAMAAADVAAADGIKALAVSDQIDSITHKINTYGLLTSVCFAGRHGHRFVSACGERVSPHLVLSFVH